VHRRVPSVLALGVLISLLAGCAGQSATPPEPTPTIPDSVHVAQPTPAPAPTPAPPTFDRAARSIDDPASVWVVVDKIRPVNPVDFVPPDLVDVPVAHTWEPMLRLEASNAVVGMFQTASVEAGLALKSNSAYRSYESQVSVYNGEVAANGQAVADTDTARPGYSEHQTGLAIDIGADSGNCSLDVCFAGTPEGQWLAANAWRFGFLLRYPADKTPVTGYSFEPWHFRYIGPELAAELHNTGVTTLEEFFGLPPAPGYL
jgi:D-alanyl-D-alanine carboxypeptidase